MTGQTGKSIKNYRHLKKKYSFWELHTVLFWLKIKNQILNQAEPAGSGYQKWPYGSMGRIVLKQWSDQTSSLQDLILTFNQRRLLVWTWASHAIIQHTQNSMENTPHMGIKMKEKSDHIFKTHRQGYCRLMMGWNLRPNMEEATKWWDGEECWQQMLSGETSCWESAFY